MKLLIVHLLFLITRLSEALDFDQAVKRKMFHKIGGITLRRTIIIFMLNILDYPHRTFIVHPEHSPALNLYYDNSGVRINSSFDWTSASRRTIEIILGLASSDNPIILSF